MTHYLKGTSEQYKLQFFRKVLKVVSDFHKHGIFHLDIKPENIFVDDDEPVFIDFG